MIRIRFLLRHRPLHAGSYVDHMIDTFGGFFLMGGLAISGLIDWRIALGMFVAFLMLSVQVYLATYTVGTFQLSFAKFAPRKSGFCWRSEMWRCGFIRTLGSSGTALRIFDAGGIVAIAGMSVMLVISTIYNTVKLYRAEMLK